MIYNTYYKEIKGKDWWTPCVINFPFSLALSKASGKKWNVIPDRDPPKQLTEWVITQSPRSELRQGFHAIDSPGSTLLTVTVVGSLGKTKQNSFVVEFCKLVQPNNIFIIWQKRERFSWWKYGSAVKNLYSSLRQPDWCSQYLVSKLTITCNSNSRGSMTLASLGTGIHAHMHRDTDLCSCNLERKETH